MLKGWAGPLVMSTSITAGRNWFEPVSLIAASQCTMTPFEVVHYSAPVSRMNLEQLPVPAAVQSQPSEPCRTPSPY